MEGKSMRFLLLVCLVAALLTTSHSSNEKFPKLRGMNLPSMEWKDLGEPQLETAAVAAYDQWKANVIRLPLSQDRWFGKAEEQKDGGVAYRDKVDRLVKIASDRHKYIILDLHWSNCNEWGKNVGQHKMPDEKSLLFWQDVARLYGKSSYVIFDLFNEPFDVTWEVWANGGHVEEKISGKRVAYRAIGMKSLVTAVRDAGAENWLVISGLAYSSDFRGILDGHDIKDSKVIYGIHVYPGKNWSNFTCIVGKYPVIFTEFGAEAKDRIDTKKWLKDFWAYAEENDIGWAGWSFHVALHPMIKDWDFNPTEYGVDVKEALNK
jgi:hypothetical protein